MGTYAEPNRAMPVLSPSASRECLTEADADVFDGVVGIDFEVAFAGDGEVE